MGKDDFGPVPVSRLKDEIQDVFTALEDGRRVLVSRHGHVVAAIDPASLPRHTPTLAAFALRAPSIAELTATDIGQGSPSEAVRRAQDGERLLVTRSNKVYGVLGPSVAEESLESVIRQEEALARFERDNPDAGAQEFVVASQQARVHGGAASEAVPLPIAPGGAQDPPVEEVIVDAMLVKGMVLESRSDLEGAARAFRGALDFAKHPGLGVRLRVGRAMVELAKVYAAEGRAAEAVGLTDQAVDLLGATRVPTVRSEAPVTIPAQSRQRTPELTV